MAARRLQRWISIETALVQYLMFSGTFSGVQEPDGVHPPSLGEHCVCVCQVIITNEAEKRSVNKILNENKIKLTFISPPQLC